MSDPEERLPARIEEPPAPPAAWVSEDKELTVAYLLALLGWVTPAAGLHRFYLGKPVSAVVFLLTWGLLGFGTLYDLIFLPKQVSKVNRDTYRATRQAELMLGPGASHLPPEQMVLRVAHANQGVTTAALVALQTGMDIEKAQRELERLQERGHCTVDVNAEGARVYIFGGLRGTDPLDIA